MEISKQIKPLNREISQPGCNVNLPGPENKSSRQTIRDDLPKQTQGICCPLPWSFLMALYYSYSVNADECSILSVTVKSISQSVRVTAKKGCSSVCVPELQLWNNEMQTEWTTGG